MAPFIRSLNVEVLGGYRGSCETLLRASPTHQQQHGFIHAGVVMALADHTCGGAAVSAVTPEHDVLTVENNVCFLRPASGDLYCRAQVLRAGKNIVFTEAEVLAGAEHARRLVAKMSSTLSVVEKAGLRKS